MYCIHKDGCNPFCTTVREANVMHQLVQLIYCGIIVVVVLQHRKSSSGFLLALWIVTSSVDPREQITLTVLFFFTCYSKIEYGVFRVFSMMFISSNFMFNVAFPWQRILFMVITKSHYSCTRASQTSKVEQKLSANSLGFVIPVISMDLRNRGTISQTLFDSSLCDPT